MTAAIEHPLPTTAGVYPEVLELLVAAEVRDRQRAIEDRWQRAEQLVRQGRARLMRQPDRFAFDLVVDGADGERVRLPVRDDLDRALRGLLSETSSKDRAEFLVMRVLVDALERGELR